MDDYRCGSCGAPLDEKTLDSGVCPSCNARISPFGDVIRPGTRSQPLETGMIWPDELPQGAANGPPTLTDMRRAPLSKKERVTYARATPLSFQLPPEGAPPNRATTFGLLLGLGVAAVFVIGCTLIFFTTALANGPQSTLAPAKTTVAIKRTPEPTHDPNDLGFATQVANPTPLPYTYATPTLEPTTTPFGGPPTPTPPPDGNGTPTAGPITAMLTPNSGPCPYPGAILTIITSNQTAWLATTHSGYLITPNQGTGSQRVSVSNITRSGSIGITTDGFSQGAQVTFSCANK